jgi:nitroreductase
MKVSEAITSRRSIRAFLDRPVEEDVLRRIIERAARAPSGGNLQPWHIYMLRGEPLTQFKQLMSERVAAEPGGEGAGGEGVDYVMYPEKMGRAYMERRSTFGEALYTSLGIQRGDRESRSKWMHHNYQFYDAPAGLFCYVSREAGPMQWADLGMYLQSVMLLLREEGLDSCPQAAWARYGRTVSSFLRAPDDQMLFCGMAIGYADAEHPVNTFATERILTKEFATFLGFDGAGS